MSSLEYVKPMASLQLKNMPAAVVYEVRLNGICQYQGCPIGTLAELIHLQIQR